ncbi:hypothetical protein BDZ91DRAFT_708822 [Kalaharituber pfeilii]|nr:hypothetical protein BDZ91DRAFT_708822 [Kalaharituber pfeilii]
MADSAAPDAALEVAAPAAAPAPVVPFFKRTNKSKSSIRKRPATPPPATEHSSSDEDSDNGDDDEETKRRIKRQKKTGISDASKVSSSGGRGADDEIVPSGFTAKSKGIVSTNDATKSTSYHNESEVEYLARKNKPTAPPDPESLLSDGTYKGQSSYATFIKRSENAPPRQAGPLKAPTNIRTITVTDFAPDVCKDYKQTGFCGFGDSCKFLHAREDYAQGWQLDKDWEIKKKNPNAKTSFKTLENASQPVRQKEEEDELDKELKDVPFACVICKKEYKSPIVTKCGHYFCEMCAINRYKKKNPSCAICGARTDGVFNVAKNLQKKLDLKKKRIEEKEKAEAERKKLEEEAGPVIQGGW